MAKKKTRMTPEEKVDLLVSVLKRARKPLTSTDLQKKSKLTPTIFYGALKDARDAKRVHRTEEGLYTFNKSRSPSKKKPKRAAPTGQKSESRTCRDCGETKPLNDQNWGRMSPIVTAKTGEVFYPNCRICRQVTPTMRSTVEFVKNHGTMTAKQMSDITGLNGGLCSNRLRTACAAGFLFRKGMGVYAITEEGNRLDTSRTEPLSSKTINRSQDGSAMSGSKSQTKDFERGLKLIDVVLNRGGLDDDDQVTLEVARNLIAGDFVPTPDRAPDVVIAELD